MANEEHLEILKKGVDVWNKWRKDNREIMPDLCDADLSHVVIFGIDLCDANLIRANLKTANLSYANLDRATVNSANLSYANLRNANLNYTALSRTNLRYANLDSADLSNSQLISTNLSNAQLVGVNLSKIIIGNTIFGNVDLSEVKGLESVIHKGPSTIGIDTIYRSRGKISEMFLRRAGVPDIFINYMQSLVDISPIEYYSCFISYSGKDTNIAERLYADLIAKGLRVWFFPESAKWGGTVWGEIDHAIRVYDKLIVLCSENSLKSTAVIEEMERVLDEEAKHLKNTGKVKNILFPITLDSYLFDKYEHPIKPRVLRKVVGDFRGCKTNMNKYNDALDKLIKALEAED